jgi:NAD(P)-dependent dehydrogenase (short-subunit alcohol dehydrogenase family)
VESFTGKLAVVTGGGSGMGRELVCQLAEDGCSVATCDVNPDAAAETARIARGLAGSRATVTSHQCDVSAEEDILRFRDEVAGTHQRDHIDLVFNNAGIIGGCSFVNGSREEWDRIFSVNWWGVYYTTRAFMPLLMRSPAGVLVNTSSVNGFWATLGPGRPNTAYSAAKFAVKGFSEALIEDLRTHAPHVRVAVVMPGRVGTNIVLNSLHARGLPAPEHMSDRQLGEVFPDAARRELIRAGALPEYASPDDLRQILLDQHIAVRDTAPLSPRAAAASILEGIRSGAWRILVGDDAKSKDAEVRANPETAYEARTK